MSKCADVIVTYNRKPLLEENISALLNQTYEDHDILIIDNASTDGTKEMVLALDNPKIKYFNTGKNLGGAGGFAFGMRKALEGDYSYAWLMDDDSMPEKDALESLVRKAELVRDEFSFMTSLVYWTDNHVFPMNYPIFDSKNIIKTPCNYLRDYKLVPISVCSFVGCFVNLQVAEKVGLPIAEFFIYADDVEYTRRLNRQKPAYLDMDSAILHKAPSNQGADIVTAGADRIERFYHQSRNGMYVARKNKMVLKRFVKVAKRFVKVILRSPDHKAKRIWMLVKGTAAGFFFNPPIQYVTRGK